jgi:hypothetical protein
MSEAKVRNAIIRCIRRRVEPHMWPSGYVDAKEPGGYLMLWSPATQKAFRRNKEITDVWAVGRDWVCSDAYGGGMVRHSLRKIPLADLTNILEWLLQIDLDAEAVRRKKAS